MRRNQQSNEIRTNILFEIAVVGETAVRDTLSAIFDATTSVEAGGAVCRVVGISLKKPTSNAVFLTKNTVQLEVDNTILYTDNQDELPEENENENTDGDSLEDETEFSEVSNDD